MSFLPLMWYASEILTEFQALLNLFCSRMWFSKYQKYLLNIKHTIESTIEFCGILQSLREALSLAVALHATTSETYLCMRRVSRDFTVHGGFPTCRGTSNFRVNATLPCMHSKDLLCMHSKIHTPFIPSVQPLSLEKWPRPDRATEPGTSADS